MENVLSFGMVAKSSCPSQAVLSDSSQLEPIKRTTDYLNRLNKHNKFFNPKSTKSKAVQYTPDEIVMPKNYKKYQKDRGEPITDSKVWSSLFGGKSEE